MRHGVSFRKLKITNNKDRPGSNVSTMVITDSFRNQCLIIFMISPLGSTALYAQILPTLVY